MKTTDAFADYEGVVSLEFGLLRQVGLPNSTVLLHRAQHAQQHGPGKSIENFDEI